MTPIKLDFQNPDYRPIFDERIQRLQRIRENPGMLPGLFEYYRLHPADFICDFGMTTDPRNLERGLPAETPFILFPKQVEWVDWVMERWRNQEPGISEKSRDSGLSWLMVALACTLALFNRGLIVGVGSRKEIYVDQIGSPKSLFEKARFFLSRLPAEFLGGWDRDRHAPHMRIVIPATGSAICGEAGDGIGRGDRASIYFIDESAFLERPQLIDASLSGTTNCRIDVSTPNGRGNSFATRRFSGTIPVFSFHWKSDPRKTEDWYRRQCEQLDPVTLAAEVDISYSGSAEGLLIPSAWINAAIGAHIKLGIEPSGFRRAALDIADQGRDLNAFASRHGILLDHCHSWSGKNSDIYATVVRAFDLCDTYGITDLDYDSDGLGSGVRGDARVLNETREASNRRRIADTPFRGSGSVWRPDSEMVPGRKNQDFFANAKAQAWWALRLRFQQTYRAVVEGQPFVADDLISISPDLEELLPLTLELAQPTYSLTNAGRVIVDKAPEGARSPNLADAVMICFAPSNRVIEMWTRLNE